MRNPRAVVMPAISFNIGTSDETVRTTSIGFLASQNSGSVKYPTAAQKSPPQLNPDGSPGTNAAGMSTVSDVAYGQT